MTLKSILKDHPDSYDTLIKTSLWRNAITKWHSRTNMKPPGGIGSLNASCVFVFYTKPKDDIYKWIEKNYDYCKTYVTWITQTPFAEKYWREILEQQLKIIQPMEIVVDTRITKEDFFSSYCKKSVKTIDIKNPL